MIEPVPTRDPRASCPDGVRARGWAPVLVGDDHVDRHEVQDDV